jgi:16S rRNA processing protein RimM
MTPINDPLVIIGKIGKTFGIKGWLKLHSYTDPYENIFSYTPWFIKEKNQWRELAYEDYAIQGQQLIIKFPSLNVPETAKQLTNCEIAIKRSQLPDLTEKEYYWSDLQNLQVITNTGVELGYIDHIFETGAHPILVVKGDKERLIPLVMGNIVKEVKLSEKRIIVDWDPTF